MQGIGHKAQFSDIARRYRRDRHTVAAYWKAAASGSPTGPSRPAPRALRGTGVPHHPRHPPGIGGLSPWISPCGLEKRQWPDALLVRAGKPIRMASPIKNGRRPAPAPKIGHAFCPISHAFCPIGPAGPAFPSRGKQKEGPAASGSPTGPSRPAPRALRGTGVPHHPRHPPGIGGLSPWISPCGLEKRQWPDALLVRAGKPIRMASPIKNGRRPAPAPKIGHAFCPISHAFCPIGPAGPAFPSRGKQKEGPAVSGGPLGNPWWSLGGSNP